MSYSVSANVKLPLAQIEELDRIAREEDISRAELIKRAVEIFLAAYREKRGLSPDAPI